MQMITSVDELFNYISMFLVQLLKYVFVFPQKPKRHKFGSRIIINIFSSCNIISIPILYRMKNGVLYPVWLAVNFQISGFKLQTS